MRLLAAALGVVVVVALALLAQAQPSGPVNPTAPPSSGPEEVACLFAPDRPVADRPVQWTVLDRTGSLRSCRVSPGQPGELLPDASTVFVRGVLGEDSALELVWLESACSGRGTITLDRRDGSMLIDLSLVDDTGHEGLECPAVGIPSKARLDFAGSVDPLDVVARHDPVPD